MILGPLHMGPVDRADSVTGTNFVFRSYENFQPGRLKTLISVEGANGKRINQLYQTSTPAGCSLVWKLSVLKVEVLPTKISLSVQALELGTGFTKMSRNIFCTVL